MPLSFRIEFACAAVLIAAFYTANRLPVEHVKNPAKMPTATEGEVRGKECLIIPDGKYHNQELYPVDPALVTFGTMPSRSCSELPALERVYTGRESIWAKRFLSLRKGVSSTAYEIAAITMVIANAAIGLSASWMKAVCTGISIPDRRFPRAW